LIGFGYWVVKKLKGKLNPALCYLHAIIMIANLIGYIVLINISNDIFMINKFLIIGLFSMIFIAQPIYVINLMLGIFNWQRDRKVRL
jgi:hypothetical protein